MERSTKWRPHGVRAVLASVSLVIGVGVCAGSASGAADSATAGTSAKVKGAGISLTYPSDWIVLPMTVKQLKAAEKVLAKDPELLAQTKQFIKSGAFRYVKLRAVAGSGAAHEGVVVQVMPGEPGDPGLDGVIDLADQIFQQTGGEAENSGEVTPIDGKIAYRIDGKIPVTYATGTVDTTASLVVIPHHHGNLVVVQVAAVDDEAGQQVVDDVVESLRLS